MRMTEEEGRECARRPGAPPELVDVVEEVAVITGREIPLREGFCAPEEIDEIRRFLRGC